MDPRKSATHRIPSPPPRTWDARLARRLVTPLVGTPVTPNHLTTLRLLIGLAGAWCLTQPGFGWINAGALLIVLSNFVDHTDGELARISGQSSKLGHFYDLASDACGSGASCGSFNRCSARKRDGGIPFIARNCRLKFDRLLKPMR